MVFIGNFIQITNQQETAETERRYGEFNLIVAAEDKDAAIEKFRERILGLRENSNFFEGQCSVFFVQLLEFEEFPRMEAMMLNYKSYAGDPIMPFIGCSIPSEVSDACRIYDWMDNVPKIDGQEEKLFLEFTA